MQPHFYGVQSMASRLDIQGGVKTQSLATVREKTCCHSLASHLLPNDDQFSKKFSLWGTRKFVIKSSWKVILQLKHVATLSCEMHGVFLTRIELFFCATIYGITSTRVYETQGCYLVTDLFGRPFVKRFALCYGPLSVCHACLSCPVLSVMFVHCGQTVGRIKMKLGMQVGLGPGHIVLDGDPTPPPPKGHSPPNFQHISVVAKWLDGLRCHFVWK